VTDRDRNGDDEEDDDGHSGRRLWLVRGLLVVAFGLLGWTIYDLGWRDVLNRLASIGPWFVVVIAIDAVMTVVDSIAIHSFLDRELRKHFGRTVTAQIIGRATNAISPIGGLGSVVKVLMLAGDGPRTVPVAAVIQVNMVALWIEVVVVAIGVPITLALLDLAPRLELALWIAAGVAAVIAIALPILATRGFVASIFGLLRRIRVVSPKTLRRMKRELGRVDRRIKPARSRARRKDQLIGAIAVLVSHCGSWSIKCILVYAAGGPTAVGFLAAIIALGQAIYWVSKLVPMGIGVTEGGNYAVFAALGANPAIGVTIGLAARVIDLSYAMLGAILTIVSPSVRELRDRARRNNSNKR
jgi:hypothetical protein